MQSPAVKRGPSGSLVWVALALIVLPVLALYPVLSAQFLTWDDYENVAKNPAMLDTSNAAVADWWTNLDKPYAELYIPLTYTAWSMLAPLARLDTPGADGIGLSPGVFHLANLLVHLGSTVLVFFILLRLIHRPWPATAGALLFAIHPVQVESVAWVTGMKDVLSGFLSFAALYCFLQFGQFAAAPVLAGKNQKRRPAPLLQWFWYGVGLIAFALSTVAKPSSVVVPVLAAILISAEILLASNIAFAPRSAKTVPPISSRRRLIRPLLWLCPLLIVSLLVILETRHAQPATRIDYTPIWIRPFIAGDALAFYAGKMLVPFHLVPDYGRTPAIAGQGGWIYFAWLIPLAIVIGAIAVRKKFAWLLPAIAFFVIAVAPVLGLMPFSFQLYSTVADHYLYVAMLGPALLLAAILTRLNLRFAIVSASAALLSLSIVSFIQAGRWHDSVKLFTYTLSVNPRSFVSHGQLAYIAAGKGEPQLAGEHYQAAVAIRPGDFFSNFNWGNLLLREGKIADAAGRFQAAVSSTPESAPAHNNYGIALIRLGRGADAAREFQLAAYADPKYADAELNLGRVMLMQRNLPAAYEHFQRTLQIDPNNEAAKRMVQQLNARR